MEEAEEKSFEGKDRAHRQEKPLLEQLRDVFNACDTEGQGYVSLGELANISRSHVSRSQVEQILEILGPEEEGRDKVDFDEFYLKFVEYMKNGVNMGCDNGVFNENLKRAFEKDDPVSKGPSKLLRRRSSQTKQSGRIPLVNTSSEDEAEDSFDRKIASSLSLARPMDMQSKFLVRGSYVRSSVRRTSNTSPTNISTSTKRCSLASKPSPSSIMRMSPILAPSGGSSFNSPASSLSSSPRCRSGSQSPTGRLDLHELQRKVVAMTEMVEKQVENDSVSSGLGSARTDLEDEISSSILLVRKHGEERLEAEKEFHEDFVRAMERERDLERRNFQLRFEQFEDEQQRLKKEVEDLKGKLKLVNLEKDHLEEQIILLEEGKRKRAVIDNDVEERRKDNEEVLMKTVEKLTSRIQTQDQDLAETKEDNIVLRSQVLSLKVEKAKDSREGGRFNIFGGAKGEAEIVDNGQYDDPSDIRIRLKAKDKELSEQLQCNKELNEYVQKVLLNVMAKNPQLLENIGQM